MRRSEERGYELAAKADGHNYQHGEGSVDNDDAGLNGVFIVLRHAHELDHRVAKQPLFNDFYKCDDGEIEGPDTIFFGRNVAYQYKERYHPKKDNRKAVQDGKQQRLAPER